MPHLLSCLWLVFATPLTACAPDVSGGPAARSLPYLRQGPQVVFGRPTIRGSLPAEFVRSVLRKRRGEFQACYRKAMGDKNGAPGDVVVQFVVGADGRVKNTRLVSSTLRDESLKSCLREEIARLRFPSTCSGLTIIDQPIGFRRPAPPPAPPVPRPRDSRDPVATASGVVAQGFTSASRGPCAVWPAGWSFACG